MYWDDHQLVKLNKSGRVLTERVTERFKVSPVSTDILFFLLIVLINS